MKDLAVDECRGTCRIVWPEIEKDYRELYSDHLQRAGREAAAPLEDWKAVARRVLHERIQHRPRGVPRRAR